MAEGFIIRVMDESDSAKIAAIDEKCIKNFWTEQDYLDLFRYMDNYYLVAEVNREIVGFVGIIKYVDTADITRIAVLEEHRGKHIATELMKRMFNLALSKGIKDINLEVRVSNDKAKALYDGLGFEELGIRKNYYSNPFEDAIVMVKHLK